MELPVLPNHFTSGLQVPSESSSQSRPPNFNWPHFTADLTVDQVLAQIRSGVNLDQLAFREGNITYQNLNRNANPHLCAKLSNAVDDNYEQTFHEESENEDEDEDLHPLPILRPTLTQESEPSSRTQMENWRDALANTWKQR